MVHWLRLRTLNAGDVSLISRWGTEILHDAWHGQREKRKKKKKNEPSKKRQGGRGLEAYTRAQRSEEAHLLGEPGGVEWGGI